MQMTNLKKYLSVALCIVLIAAMALFASGGNSQNSASGISTPDTTASSVEPTVLGEGNTKFNFTVTDISGIETAFQINTDKTTVGEALVELKLIDGDMGDYGLYVKTVNGNTLDYEKDKKYWAFYVNGQYASTGVDTTEIEAGATYSFKAE